MIYLNNIIELYSQNQNRETAEPMEAYMKNMFPFFGIKRPQRNILQRALFNKYGLPNPIELAELTRGLWARPERELQYFAMDLLVMQRKKLPEDFIVVLEEMIVNNSWWDTVDLIAGKLVSVHFQRFPNLRDEWIGRWRKSENIWLRRTCLLFQLHYKQDTDVELMFSLIKENLGSKEFFINKAIGWCLREYSKTDAEVVIDFVEETELTNLSSREALKWLKNQGRIQ